MATSGASQEHTHTAAYQHATPGNDGRHTHDGRAHTSDSELPSHAHDLHHGANNSVVPGSSSSSGEMEEIRYEEYHDEVNSEHAILHNIEATQRLHQELAELDVYGSAGEQRSELAKRVYRIRAHCRFAHAVLACAAERPPAWPVVLPKALESLHGRMQEYLDVAVHERFVTDKSSVGRNNSLGLSMSVSNSGGASKDESESNQVEDPYSATLDAIREVESLQEHASDERSSRTAYARILQSFLEGKEPDLEKAGLYLASWEKTRGKLESSMRDVIEDVRRLFGR
jgi:hypothetical protein